MGNNEEQNANVEENQFEEDFYDPNLEFESTENNNEEPKESSGEPRDESPQVEPKEDEPKEEPAHPATAAEIANAVKEAVQSGNQQQQQEPEMTQEEIDKLLRRAKYTVDDLKAMGLVDDETPSDVADKRVKILSEMHNRSIQEAVATANLMVRQMQDEITGRISPVIEHVQTQAQQQLVNTFYETYPDLQPYEELVKLSAQQLKDTGGIKDDTPLKDAFSMVAKKTVEYVKKYGGKDINLQATQKSPQSPNSQVPKPAHRAVAGGRSQQSGTPTDEKVSEFSIYDT